MQDHRVPKTLLWRRPVMLMAGAAAALVVGGVVWMTYLTEELDEQLDRQTTVADDRGRPAELEQAYRDSEAQDALRREPQRGGNASQVPGEAVEASSAALPSDAEANAAPMPSDAEPAERANTDDDKGGLEIKYRYLVVEAVGPVDWEKTHTFSVHWKNKDVPLPVLFRVVGPAEDFEMKSGGEIFGHLKIGDEKVPVKAKPDTEFQVRNTAFGFLPEESSHKNRTALSLAASVFISPPDFPGELSPDDLKEGLRVGTVKAWGKNLARRVRELVDDGRVIDVTPEK